uniref:TOBE domain-containing protein n=1 Tax=Aliamphritea hakodatensis TaxID=2895352 RepID=UPI0035E45559
MRPEYFGNEAGIELQGEVSFVETQGRENLYDVRLGNGAVLRSIQPVRANAALGDSVSWPLNTEQVLIFDEQGQRVA